VTCEWWQIGLVEELPDWGSHTVKVRAFEQTRCLRSEHEDDIVFRCDLKRTWLVIEISVLPGRSAKPDKLFVVGFVSGTALWGHNNVA
jgi:hypothetical protein